MKYILFLLFSLAIISSTKGQCIEDILSFPEGIDTISADAKNELLIDKDCFPIDSVPNIKSENMLHPVDAFTGFTFQKNEVSVTIPVLPLSPGFIWWGINDFITMEIDLEANLGGVPSISFRFGVFENEDLAFGIETMYQYVPTKLDFDYFTEGDGTDISIKRSGSSWYNHLNMTIKSQNHLYFHFSAGAIYQDHLTIKRQLEKNGKSFNKSINPNMSIGIDWRRFNSLALMGSLSYGSTFMYLDNIPRKTQSVIGFRWAPFISSRIGVLNRFRMEGSLLYIYFHDIDKSLMGPQGYVYWQW